MKHSPLLWILFSFILFTGVECEKSHDIHPQDTSGNSGATGNDKTIYNKADTTVSLENGRITLDIPAGAMKEGTNISMEHSAVEFIDTADLLYQFALSPAGTKFNQPVIITFHYDSAWLHGNSPWDIGIAYKNEEDDQWYPAVNGSIDTVNHTLSIKTTHFSNWSIYTCFHFYMKADGQTSEDYSQTIRMQPGDIGLLLVTMDEPPAWKSDPDKSKDFGSPLVASLTIPPIDPKESYSKSITPDEWDVNAIVNGDEHVGKIMPVNGAQEKLYQYAAPSQVPSNNPVAISATIHTLTHGDIILIQPVEILGKWQMNITDSIDVETDGGATVYTYHYDAKFHIDKQSQIVFDGEDHHSVEFDKLEIPGLTSWKITSADYTKVSDITGNYENKSGFLNCNLTVGFFDGPTTVTLCAEGECDTKTTDGSNYDPGSRSESLYIKAVSGYTFKRDTTLTEEGGEVHISHLFTLQPVN